MGERPPSELLQAWVTYNEQMFQLVRRYGAPAVLEMARSWLETMGKWAERSKPVEVELTGVSARERAIAQETLEEGSDG